MDNFCLETTHYVPLTLPSPHRNDLSCRRAGPRGSAPRSWERNKMIDLQHITQEYKTSDGKGTFYACKDVNVHIRPGDIFGIIGRSGAGKSTLVRCINLLNRPTQGKVIVDGKDLTQMSDAELRAERRQIGMIFQHFRKIKPAKRSCPCLNWWA